MYLISMLLLNWGGMVVTAELTAVHRAIFEALRTFFVWISQLLIHYLITPRYGEVWNRWSFLQLGGFLVLFFSVLVYNRGIKLKCFFTYPDEDSSYSAETENSLQSSSNETQTNEISKTSGEAVPLLSDTS